VSEDKPDVVFSQPDVSDIGTVAAGGYGGRIVEVTNLGDSGPGTDELLDVVSANKEGVFVFIRQKDTLVTGPYHGFAAKRRCAHHERVLRLKTPSTSTARSIYLPRPDSEGTNR
jgi:hypothetical protein